jgi:hypothetical protein
VILRLVQPLHEFETSTALWYEDDITSGPYRAGGGVWLKLPTKHVGV